MAGVAEVVRGVLRNTADFGSSWRQFSSAPGRVPSGVRFAENDDQLAVVVPPTGGTKTADLALAWGLAFCGDRQLVMAVPARAGDPALLADGVRSRLWAFTCQALVYVYDRDSGDVTPRSPYTHAERLERVLEPTDMPVEKALRVDPPVLPVWADLGIIGDWCSGRKLQRADRQSYVAWHYEGRKLVQVSVYGDELGLSAGVHSSAPGRFRAAAEAAIPVRSLAELASVWSGLQAMVEAAIKDREAGADVGNREHRLQAHLADEWGLDARHREFPARRTYGQSGFIDLLRVQGDTIEIVETKLGFDDCLLLQGLDYLTWAEANRDLLAKYLKVPGSPKLRLRLIVGDPTTSKALRARWAGQRERLSSNVRVSWEEIVDWDVA